MPPKKSAAKKSGSKKSAAKKDASPYERTKSKVTHDGKEYTLYKRKSDGARYIRRKNSSGKMYHFAL